MFNNPSINTTTIVIYLMTLLAECGTTAVQDDLVKETIINGWDASIEEWPMYGKLLYNGGQLCGSVLIHPEWALSAAHCYDP